MDDDGANFAIEASPLGLFDDQQLPLDLRVNGSAPFAGNQVATATTTTTTSQQQQSTWSLLISALLYSSNQQESLDISWPNSILALVLIMLMLTTAIGNLFVIVAILIERNLRTIGNYLVLSLAIADLLVACLVMPLAGIYQILDRWTLGVLLCDIWTSTDVFCCTASILHLLAIALDRYWAVTRVDYIRCQRNKRRILHMILLVWMAAAVISLAPVFGWKDAEFEWRITNGHECLLSQDIGYQIFATCTTFYFPLTLTLIFYWKIYQVARKRIRRKPGNRVKISLQQPSSSSSNSSPANHSVVAFANKHKQPKLAADAQRYQPHKSIVECSRSGGFKSSIQRTQESEAYSLCLCSCHRVSAQQQLLLAAPADAPKLPPQATQPPGTGEPAKLSIQPDGSNCNYSGRCKSSEGESGSRSNCSSYNNSNNNNIVGRTSQQTGKRPIHLQADGAKTIEKTVANKGKENGDDDNGSAANCGTFAARIQDAGDGRIKRLNDSNNGDNPISEMAESFIGTKDNLMSDSMTGAGIALNKDDDDVGQSSSSAARGQLARTIAGEQRNLEAVASNGRQLAGAGGHGQTNLVSRLDICELQRSTASSTETVGDKYNCNENDLHHDKDEYDARPCGNNILQSSSNTTNHPVISGVGDNNSSTGVKSLNGGSGIPPIQTSARCKRCLWSSSAGISDNRKRSSSQQQTDHSDSRKRSFCSLASCSRASSIVDGFAGADCACSDTRATQVNFQSPLKPQPKPDADDVEQKRHLTETHAAGDNYCGCICTEPRTHSGDDAQSAQVTSSDLQFISDSSVITPRTVATQRQVNCQVTLDERGSPNASIVAPSSATCSASRSRGDWLGCGRFMRNSSSPLIICWRRIKAQLRGEQKTASRFLIGDSQSQEDGGVGPATPSLVLVVADGKQCNNLQRQSTALNCTMCHCEMVELDHDDGDDDEHHRATINGHAVKSGEQGHQRIGGMAMAAASTAHIAIKTTVKSPTLNPNSSSSIHRQSSATTEGLESKRERKAAKTLAIITGVFVMCWLPFFVIAIAMPLLNLKPHKYVFATLQWLGYINSMLNPIIYTIFSPDFRVAFKRLLCGLDKSRNEQRKKDANKLGGCSGSARQANYSTDYTSTRGDSMADGPFVRISTQLIHIHPIFAHCCLPNVSKDKDTTIITSSSHRKSKIGIDSSSNNNNNNNNNNNSNSNRDDRTAINNNLGNHLPPDFANQTSREFKGDRTSPLYQQARTLHHNNIDSNNKQITVNSAKVQSGGITNDF